MSRYAGNKLPSVILGPEYPKAVRQTAPPLWFYVLIGLISGAAVGVTVNYAGFTSQMEQRVQHAPMISGVVHDVR
ncbi:hypothetical protein [Hyphomicrobium sp. ghe19]|uniref:hypothetical protein n=1 Tax=Hyphomicrobium sp. ghe19 TaxID=2682968 RepID=UPI001366E5D9|nr:hypothetical protein HYPP_02451 [Hyphomicrobium sp. ghe19]